MYHAGPVTAPPQPNAAPLRNSPARAPLGARGNQAALRRLQAKLTVGAVDDPLEHEADAVAEQVMRMPDPAVVAGSSPPGISRKCAACEEEDKVQPKRSGNDPAGGEAPDSVTEALNASGRPLDGTTRAFFEPRFGADFSGVRIHDDGNAVRSAREVGARAYAVGSHIVFDAGNYAPHGDAGRHLLAHELTHTVQQDTASPQTETIRRNTPPPSGGGLADQAKLQTSKDIIALLQKKTDPDASGTGDFPAAFKILTDLPMGDALATLDELKTLGPFATLQEHFDSAPEPDRPRLGVAMAAVQEHGTVTIDQFKAAHTDAFTALPPEQQTAIQTFLATPVAQAPAAPPAAPAAPGAPAAPAAPAAPGAPAAPAAPAPAGAKIANSCDNATQVQPIIVPGQAKAKSSVALALDATKGPKVSDAATATTLRKFFGPDATTDENLAKIHTNFAAINSALNGSYTVHCSKKGDSSDPGALECKGQNAKTSQEGSHDVTLCFDKMDNWTEWWAAWIFVHENGHRALGDWEDPYQAGTIDHCTNPVNPFPQDIATSLGTPESYACFAVTLGLTAAVAAAQENEPKMQRAARSDGTTAEAPPEVDGVLNTPGEPLNAAAREFFEPRFGADFSPVRVHTGSDAATSARAVGARAYTVGSHLVFGAGEYAPGAPAGQELIAHELAHVVQQGGGKIQREPAPPASGSAPPPAPPVPAPAPTQQPGGPAPAPAAPPACTELPKFNYTSRPPTDILASSVVEFLANAKAQIGDPFTKPTESHDMDLDDKGIVTKVNMTVDISISRPRWAGGRPSDKEKALILKAVDLIKQHEADHKAIAEQMHKAAVCAALGKKGAAANTAIDDVLCKQMAKAQEDYDMLHGEIVVVKDATGAPSDVTTGPVATRPNYGCGPAAKPPAAKQ